MNQIDLNLDKNEEIILVFDGKIMKDEKMINDFDLELNLKLFFFEKDNIKDWICIQIRILQEPQEERYLVVWKIKNSLHKKKNWKKSQEYRFPIKN